MHVRRRSLLILALALVASPLSAQAPPDFLVEFEGKFNASARKFVTLAEAMPADALDWRPMEGVSSVAEVFMHVARYNYYYTDDAMGQDSPIPAATYDSWEGQVTDKDQIVEILSGSMDHVRNVVSGLSPEDLNRMTRLYGRDVGDWAVLFQLVSHMNEHLGQSIAYARMNQVVPPWSR